MASETILFMTALLGVAWCNPFGGLGGLGAYSGLGGHGLGGFGGLGGLGALGGGSPCDSIPQVSFGYSGMIPGGATSVCDSAQSQIGLGLYEQPMGFSYGGLNLGGASLCDSMPQLSYGYALPQASVCDSITPQITGIYEQTQPMAFGFSAPSKCDSGVSQFGIIEQPMGCGGGYSNLGYSGISGLSGLSGIGGLGGISGLGGLGGLGGISGIGGLGGISGYSGLGGISGISGLSGLGGLGGIGGLGGLGLIEIPYGVGYLGGGSSVYEPVSSCPLSGLGMGGIGGIGGLSGLGLGGQHLGLGGYTVGGLGGGLGGLGMLGSRSLF